MRIKDLQALFDSAGLLTIEDILLTESEASLFRRCLVHAILQVIVKNGGAGFKVFSEDLEWTQPVIPMIAARSILCLL